MKKTKITTNGWRIKEIAKITSARILQVFIRALYIFPIKKNRIVLHSFKGRQFSCNPKAITEYLLAHFPKKFEIIWAFRDVEQFSDLKKLGIKCVRYVSIKRVYLEATSAFSINNVGSFNWLPIRKYQLHINTWHGGGCYKKLSTDSLSDISRKLTSAQTSHMISSSSFFSDFVIRGEFGFNKQILQIGMPRNDVFFNIDLIQGRNVAVRTKYKIPRDNILILYAPTWRFDKNINFPDFKLVSEAVRELTDKNSTIISRTHYYLNGSIPDTINVNDYRDMQDLLCAADILITDYSSSIWDYSFLYRPCFLFVDDLESYNESRGFCKEIHTWGFPVCTTNDELYKAIVNFDSADFRRKMEKHHDDLGSFETGHATEKICDFLVKHLENAET